MHITQPHTMTKGEARTRMQLLTKYWQAKYGVAAFGDGDKASVSGKVKGIAFDAVITVGEGQVQATTSDPGWLMRGAAKSYVHGKLEEYLG
jgi:hypothetical protein